LGGLIALLILSILTGGWLLRRKAAPEGTVYQQARLFENVVSSIHTHYIDSLGEGELYQTAAKALVSSLRDPYAELLTRVWEEHRLTVMFVTHDIDEAVFLSDRVLVMTARPGRIKEDIEIGLERPRTFEIFSTPEFFEYKARLLESVREESLRTAAETVAEILRQEETPEPGSRLEIQQALADKGYYEGPIDGKWDAQCIEALKRFQEDHHFYH
jgi:hypothetical protein